MTRSRISPTRNSKASGSGLEVGLRREARVREFGSLGMWPSGVDLGLVAYDEPED